ncbi:HD domain-containing protein [bacterium]|nr:HD domain-containing protein [bacterium]
MYPFYPQELAIMQTHTRPARAAHSVRVAETAWQLARHWGADEGAAYQAGLLHDVAKAYTPDTLPMVLPDRMTELWQAFPAVWHALIGPDVVRACHLPISETVAEAIRWHTTGCDQMSCLTQVVFVADYIEPQRPFANREQVEALAYQHLEGAVLAIVSVTIRQLINRSAPVHPHAIGCYNAMCRHGEREGY